MKIYTKTGDKGKTSLLSGNRVPKYHLRVETYGTIDELTSYIGLLRSADIPEQIKQDLIKIQRTLFNISGILACDKGKLLNMLQKVSDADIKFLEEKIDQMTETVGQMKYFILPGGQYETALCHICRVITRKAERKTIELADKETIFDQNIIPYLNRLSDYFFTLSRYIAQLKNFQQLKV